MEASFVRRIFLTKKVWKKDDSFVFLLSAIIVGLDQWLKFLDRQQFLN